MSLAPRAEPRVTIGVPLYNGAAFLEDCFRAIHAQDFTDFEVVVVDDGSTDDGPAIARAWAARDPRFKVFANERNLGLVGNWNRCIELATGEWIKFVFQDDLVAKDCLTRLLAAGERSGGFVACARALILADDVDDATRAWYARHEAALDAIYARGESFSADDYALARLGHLDYNIVGEPSVTMVRRSLFETYGRFDARFAHICDSEMWDRLGANVGVVRVADRLASFRIHRGAASAVFRTKPFRGAALDPMMLFFDMCHAAHFARLRTVAERHGRMGVLRRRLTEAVHHAFDLARTTKRAHPEGRRQVHEDLVASTDRMMGYRTARNGHLLFRVRRMLGLTGRRHDHA